MLSTIADKLRYWADRAYRPTSEELRALAEMVSDAEQLWADEIDALDSARCYGCEEAHRREDLEEVFDGSEKYCANCAEKWRRDAAQEEDTRSMLDQLER